MNRTADTEVGMNAVPPTWRIYRISSAALYILLAAAFVLGLFIGTFTA